MNSGFKVFRPARCAAARSPGVRRNLNFMDRQAPSSIFLFFLSLAIFTGWLFYAFAADWKETRRIPYWPSGDGVLESAKFVRISTEPNSDFEIRVVYTFTSNGQTYQGRAFRKKQVSSNSLEQVKAWFEESFGAISPLVTLEHIVGMELAKPGQHVVVFYDPADPTHSYLDVSPAALPSPQTYLVQLAASAALLSCLILGTFRAGKRLIVEPNDYQDADEAHLSY